MTEKYSFKAYLALFNLLDLKFEKSKDSQLGRLLGDMNPNLFADDTSADSADYSALVEHLRRLKLNSVHSERPRRSVWGDIFML